MSNSIGNLKNSGLQGNNFPWQLKMLQGLQAIYDATSGPLTCVDQVTVCGTSFTVIDNISALNVNVVNPIPLEVVINEENDSILIYGFDGTDNQPISVDTDGNVNIRQLDCGDKVSVCFNDGVNDITVSTTNPLPTTATVIFPTGSGTLCDDAVAITFCNTLLQEFLDQGTTLDAIQTAVEGTLTVDGTVNVGNSTLAVTQSGAWTVTANQGTNPWVIGDGGGSITVDGAVTVSATNLDIRNLTFATDSVNVSGSNVNATVSGTVAVSGISDGTDSLEINTDGSINVNATIDCATSSIAICDGTPGGSNLAINTDGSINTTLVGPTGVQLDCGNAISTALCQTQEDILTDIQSSVAPLTSVTPNILISSGDAPVTIAAAPYSITFFNNGSTSVNVSFDFGVTNVSIPAGVTITMDAGGIKNTYQANQFVVGDTTAVGASMIVTYNS